MLGGSSIEMLEVTDCGVEGPVVGRANISSLICSDRSHQSWSLVNFNIYSAGITHDIILVGVGCVVTCREELKHSS